jgi:ATP-dependent helicase/nuclease subunit B
MRNLGDQPGSLAPRQLQGTPDAHADKARAMLAGIVARFADEATPYRALVSPMWKARYGDYDHLARVKEWSAMGGPDEGDGE